MGCSFIEGHTHGWHPGGTSNQASTSVQLGPWVSQNASELQLTADSEWALRGRAEEGAFPSASDGGLCTTGSHFLSCPGPGTPAPHRGHCSTLGQIL